MLSWKRKTYPCHILDLLFYQMFISCNQWDACWLFNYVPFFNKKKFYQKSRHEKEMCTSPFSKNTTQKERESIKSTKDMEGVPTRAHIQSNNDHKTCSLIRQAVRFHQRPVYFFHTADSIWRTKARLATRWLLCGAETDIAKIQTVQPQIWASPKTKWRQRTIYLLPLSNEEAGDQWIPHYTYTYNTNQLSKCVSCEDC